MINRNEIPGIKEIEDYKALIDEFFERMKPGACPPEVYPKFGENLTEKYPLAAALLQAEAWEKSKNAAKAASGHKAVEEILQGRNYQAALHDMICRIIQPAC